MMGLKEFFTIKMFYFRSYPNIPSFHSDGVNRLLFKDLLSREVVEYPRREIINNIISLLKE